MTSRQKMWMLVALGTAAVVLLAVVLVPNLLDRGTTQPDIGAQPPSTSETGPATEVSPPLSTPTPVASDPTLPPPDDPTLVPPDEPASEPTDAPPPATDEPGSADSIPDRYVTTDGTDIVLHQSDGENELVFTQPSEGESTISNVAVRPAGDRDDDTTIVFLSQGEGMWFLRYVVIHADTQENPEQFPTQYDISEGARGSDTPPVPVWSPDGRHLAWIEDVGRTATLRTIGWSDGPGTGDTADDNASFDVSRVAGVYPTLEDWVWTAGMDTETAGFMFIAVPREEDGSAYILDIERQSDGALALSAEPYAIASEQTYYVDSADSHANDGAAVGPQYQLVIEPSGTQDDSLNLHLYWTADGDQRGEMPVPDELKQGADPSAFWMTAREDGVLLGRGGQAWLITRGGETEQLAGTIHDAAFLPN